MSTHPASLPQGTRDYGPEDSFRRSYIFTTLQRIFSRYGFEPLETPAMEQLETLTGKYGEEGDRLIYKILNSGDFLSKIDPEKRKTMTAKELVPYISERALRYDLTVPFARYVSMNQHLISFPFKRYQIQPVWRADRPQKGRYREFYQCDVDVVGSPSLTNEADFIHIYYEAFTALGVDEVNIRINHRKILQGIAELTSRPDQFSLLVSILDKFDKIGLMKGMGELRENGFSEADIQFLHPLFTLGGSNESKLSQLQEALKGSVQAQEGIKEIRAILDYLSPMPDVLSKCSMEVMLARGLNYYTGTILEVNTPSMGGSLGGGGRYDDLTGIFGLKGMTGVGISFGADRIFDLLKEKNLFPQKPAGSKVLIGNFFLEAQKHGFALAIELRKIGISAEFYPDLSKLAKQLKYAAQKQIPYVILQGPDEYQSGDYTLRDMTAGTQSVFTKQALIHFFEQLQNLTVK